MLPHLLPCGCRSEVPPPGRWDCSPRGPHVPAAWSPPLPFHEAGISLKPKYALPPQVKGCYTPISPRNTDVLKKKTKQSFSKMILLKPSENASPGPAWFMLGMRAWFTIWRALTTATPLGYRRRKATCHLHRC